MTFPEELLSASLDGELGDDEQRAVDAELATSPDARVNLAELSEARRALRALPVRAAPPGFFDDLLARDARRGRHRTVGWIASVAAAAAVVTAIVLPIASRTRPPVRTFVDAHVARASQTGDPISELAPAAVVRFGR